MNKEQMDGKMDQMKGSIKKAWGKLTDNDATYVEGQEDKLYGKVKELHGDSREAFDKKMSDIKASCGCTSSKSTNKSNAA